MEAIKTIHQTGNHISRASFFILFLGSLAATFTIAYFDEGHYKLYDNLFRFIFEASYSLIEIFVIAMIICAISSMPWFFLRQTVFFKQGMSVQTIIMGLVLPFIVGFGLVLLLIVAFGGR